MNKTFQIQKRFTKRQQNEKQKRLSCEELESLKERFVDYLDSSQLPPPPDMRQLSRLSMSSESESSSSSLTKPEPPTRTVSIKNFDDTISMKSIYSSCRGSIVNQTQAVRSSRSVFSIYEEEDEDSSIITSSSSSSYSKNKLERLTDFEIEKIESLYRSIGCLVLVSQSTCDLLSTTSDEITNLLNNCWKIKYNNIVPVIVFDTGYNPKRPKQLRLVFVDKKTGFPIFQSIQIDKYNMLKYPNMKDKCLTFKLKDMIYLLKFYDFFSCTEFYKFYSDTMKRNMDLFGDGQVISGCKSTMSLSYKKDKTKRNSEYFMSSSNLTCKDKRNSHFITITKHCISNPCAFQHVNSLKNDDQHVKSLIETFQVESAVETRCNTTSIKIKNLRK